MLGQFFTYRGKPVRLSGAERYLMWARSAFFVALVVAGYLARDEALWNWWQWVLFMLIAFDIAGGVTANNLNSLNGPYLSPVNHANVPDSRLLKDRWFFGALQIHTIVVAALFPTGDIVAGIVWYLLLLASIAFTRNTLLNLRRPAPFTFIVVAFCVSVYLLPIADGFEWLAPLMFLKTVFGNSIR